jgi:HEPN domain-containing protein
VTIEHHEEPALEFFRRRPAELSSRPPLASSLQHLETSFLLISAGRYPSALVSCGSAVESAMKAALNLTPDDRLDFKELMDKVEEKFPSFTKISRGNIKEFRFKRNEITHHGYSKKDDEISAILLLKTGYRLVEDCYRNFFQFELCARNGSLGGLREDLDNHLRVAGEVYKKAQGKEGLDLTYCFLSFAHTIRWDKQQSLLTDWQREVLNTEAETGEISWVFQHRQKERLSRNEPAWNFDCPVCEEYESFVCELDKGQLEKSQIRLTRGACVNCGFLVPKNCPYLLDELCKDQIDSAKPTILKDYGILP